MNAPLTKRYIAVPALNGSRCPQCAWGPLTLGQCMANWKEHGFGGRYTCSSDEEAGTPARIAIEDTPEGRAAYIAAKLEAANG